MTIEEEDIVIRALQAIEAAQDGDCTWGGLCWVLEDAVDEIQRLRAELTEVSTQLRVQVLKNAKERMNGG